MSGPNVLKLLYSNLLAESRDGINFKIVLMPNRICFVLKVKSFKLYQMV